MAQPVTLTVSQTGSTAFGGTLQNGAGVLSLVFSGGNGGLLNLSGVNTYSGGTHIMAGTLQLGSNTALNSAGALTINSGGLLDLNGFNAGVGALNGSGTIDNVAGYGTSVLTLGNGNASGSFSGTIQNSSPNGTVALVKTGSGTQYLSGTNTYHRRHDDQCGRAQGGCEQCASRPFRCLVTGGTLDASNSPQSIYSLSVGAAGALNLAIGNLLTTNNLMSTTRSAARSTFPAPPRPGSN